MYIGHRSHVSGSVSCVCLRMCPLLEAIMACVFGIFLVMRQVYWSVARDRRCSQMLHALRWVNNKSDFCWNDSSCLCFLAFAVRLNGLSREMCSTASWIDSTWWYTQTDLPANEDTCCTVLLRCISVSSLVDCHTWQWLWLWLPWRLVSNVMPFKVILGLPHLYDKRFPNTPWWHIDALLIWCERSYVSPRVLCWL